MLSSRHLRHAENIYSTHYFGEDQNYPWSRYKSPLKLIYARNIYSTYYFREDQCQGAEVTFGMNLQCRYWYMSKIFTVHITLEKTKSTFGASINHFWSRVMMLSFIYVRNIHSTHYFETEVTFGVDLWCCNWFMLEIFTVHIYLEKSKIVLGVHLKQIYIAVI